MTATNELYPAGTAIVPSTRPVAVLAITASRRSSFQLLYVPM